VGSPRSTSRARLPDDGEIRRLIRDDLLAHGVVDWSMREAGARIGVSARMLVHRFGSKDELVAAVLDDVHHMFADRWSRLTRLDPKALIDDEIEPFVRLQLGVQTLAAQGGVLFGDVHRRLTDDWVRLIRPQLAAIGVPASSRCEVAQFIVSSVRGVQYDWLIDRDLRRARRRIALLDAHVRGRS
jgi:AcrR family transcriptional regulator